MAWGSEVEVAGLRSGTLARLSLASNSNLAKVGRWVYGGGRWRGRRFWYAGGSRGTFARRRSPLGALTGCHRSCGGSRKRHENGPLQAVCCHESSLANPRSVRDNSFAHAFPLRGFRWLGWSRYRLRKRGRGRWTSIGYPTKKLPLIGRGRALAQGRVWPP